MLRTIVWCMAMVAMVVAVAPVGADVTATFQNGREPMPGAGMYSGEYDYAPHGPGWGGDPEGLSAVGRWRGTGPDLIGVINAGGGFVSRGLIRFDDLDRYLPRTAQVNSATLGFEIGWACCGTGDFQASRILSDWPTNDDAYWNAAALGGNGGVGASFTGAAMGTTPFGGNTGSFSISLDPAVVEDWIADPATNFGLVLDIINRASQPHSGMKEWDTTQSPVLTIEWVPEPASLALLGLGGLVALRRRR